MRTQKEFYKLKNQSVTFFLRDLPDHTLYKLFYDYLIRERLYSRKYDFHRILIPECNDMYYSKSNAVPLDVVQSTSSKRFKISKAIKTFEMKKDFINRLEHKGYEEIFIPYETIKKCLGDLDKESQAIIFNSIIARGQIDVSISLKRGVKQVAKDIKKLHRTTQNYRLRNAIENLSIKIIEFQN